MRPCFQRIQEQGCILKAYWLGDQKTLQKQPVTPTFNENSYKNVEKLKI